MKEAQTRRQESDYGRSPVHVSTKRRCSPWLVVVFKEAREAILEIEARMQVRADGSRVALAEPVVQPFVVRVVEALLLEDPLEIPVHLGHEDEVGMLVAHRRRSARPEWLRRHAP